MTNSHATAEISLPSGGNVADLRVTSASFAAEVTVHLNHACLVALASACGSAVLDGDTPVDVETLVTDPGRRPGLVTVTPLGFGQGANLTAVDGSGNAATTWLDPDELAGLTVVCAATAQKL